MNRFFRVWLPFSLVIGLWLGICVSPTVAAPKKPARAVWVTAYYPVWHQEDGTFLPDKIDFAAITHLIHFSVVPRADGTIDDTPVKPNSTISAAESADVIGPAHKAGCKVLLCVGGASTAPLFRPALDPAVRPRFITNLIQWVQTRGYDGLDIDMEPITDTDVPLYAAFIRELRARMTATRPGLLLTAATAWEPNLFAQLQSQFDQINLMTYDLSGPWQGFQTWYNGALHGAGKGRLLPRGTPFPSVDNTLRPFLQAGIQPRKLGIGIAFYGDVWTGTTGPAQSIQGVTDTQTSYATIMDQYYQPGRYHWDAQAQAPYLSIPASDPQGPKFISYDDARLCAAKVRYAQTHGLGGVIIWELGDGYRPNQPAGQRNVLLRAVQQAAQHHSTPILAERSR